MDILNSKTLGVGAAHDLGVGLHIKSGDSGLVAIDADADELVVEGSGNSGISILSGTSGEGAMLFGNSGDADRGGIIYDHATDLIRMIVGNGTAFRANGNSAIFLGDDANSNMTTGITINQGGADNEILTFKSTDVAHGVTSITETDTFATFGKRSGLEGGLEIRAIGESLSQAMQFTAFADTFSTGKTNGAEGSFTLLANGYSGTSISDLGADANVFAILGRCSSENRTLFIVDEDGDLFADGGTSSTNMVTQFDECDDAAVVGDFNAFLGSGSRPDFERMERLAGLKLMGSITPGDWEQGIRPLWSVTKTIQLHNGWMCQAHMREQVLWTALSQLVPGFKEIAEGLSTGRNIGSLPASISA